MNNKRIRLTENDLHRVVKKSVNRILKEMVDPAFEERAEYFNQLYFALDALETNLEDAGYVGDFSGVNNAINIIKDAISDYCD